MLLEPEGFDDPEQISSSIAIFGLVNGMIGTLVLILPILALHAGYISTLFIIIITGFFSYFSCYLYLKHLGDQPDNGYSIQKHFGPNGKAIKKIYDILASIFLLLGNIQIFQLIVQQWKGLLPDFVYLSIINPICNAIILLIFIFIVKYVYLGVSIMAYGIVSIIAYMAFLIWVVVTGDQGNDQQYPAFGSGTRIELAAAMAQGYAIQSFLVPILKKNNKQQKFACYTLIIYLIGGAIYCYIAEMGSFGIWHRYDQSPSKTNTIEDYFKDNSIPTKIIQALYVLHLYSVYPQFLLICKNKFVDIFELNRLTPKSKEIIVYIYIFAYVAITAALCNSSTYIFMVINGSILGFLLVYLFPSILHFKCIYFTAKRYRRSIQNNHRTSEIQIMNIQNQRESESLTINLIANPSNIQTRNLSQHPTPQQTESQGIQNNFLACSWNDSNNDCCFNQCCENGNCCFKYLIQICILLMVCFGILVLGYGIYQLIQNQKQNQKY